MKTTSRLLPVVLLLSFFTVAFPREVIGQSESSPSEETHYRDRQIAENIVTRVKNGEREALRELSSLDRDVAIPLLSKYLRDRSTDPSRAQVAREALKEVNGYREYFKEKLDTLAARKTMAARAEQVRSFEVLSSLATEEAVSVIAPFLLDDTEAMHEGDYIIEAPRRAAALALGRMNLPNAPTNKKPAAYTEGDIEKWRQWWRENRARYQE